MGYKNMQAVYDVNRAGRMAIRRGDNMTLNKNAELVLMFMASQTYDWDSENNCPPKKLMDKQVPCRYYTLGWRAISDALGMVMLTPEQAMGGNAEAKMKTRENSIQKSISDAWVFLAASLRPSNLLRLVRTLGFYSYWATMRRMPQWNDGPGSALASDSAMMTVVPFDLF